MTRSSRIAVTATTTALLLVAMAAPHAVAGTAREAVLPVDSVQRAADHPCKPIRLAARRADGYSYARATHGRIRVGIVGKVSRDVTHAIRKNPECDARLERAIYTRDQINAGLEAIMSSGYDVQVTYRPASQVLTVLTLDREVLDSHDPMALLGTTVAVRVMAGGITF